MLFDEVYLPLVNFLPAANSEDIFEVGIGDVDPALGDSHDLHTNSYRSSSCTNMDDDDEEHEFFDAPTTLDDLIWLAELLHKGSANSMREVATSIGRARDLAAMNNMQMKKPVTRALASKGMCRGNEEKRRW